MEIKAADKNDKVISIYRDGIVFDIEKIDSDFLVKWRRKVDHQSFTAEELFLICDCIREFAKKNFYEWANSKGHEYVVSPRENA